MVREMVNAGIARVDGGQMQWMEGAMADDLVHVWPYGGRDHTLFGFLCWCHPFRHRECPQMIIHQPDAIN